MLDDLGAEECVENVDKRSKLMDDKTGSSDETDSEGEAMWNPGNYSEEDMSWLDAINLEELEDEDFCIT